MSTSTTPGGPASVPTAETSITVISHTGLFYWWPAWVVGFLLSGLTYFDGGRLIVVPEGTKVKSLGEKAYELTVPDKPTKALEQAAEATAKGQDAAPTRMSGNRNFGMVYLVVVLLVIVGTNAPLRGLWSVVALLSLVVLTFVLAYFHLWGPILEVLGGLHVEISFAGYLVPSVVLLALWLVTVFGVDHLRYVRFTVGQLIVHKDVGDASEVYDTTRITFRKRRSDVLRHWLLGLGSGDLVIEVVDQGKEIVLPNVLFVDRKVQQIADLMKTRMVTAN